MQARIDSEELDAGYVSTGHLPPPELAAVVGTALAGALLAGLLSAAVFTHLAASPKLPPEIHAQLDLDNVTFITNDLLRTVMEATTPSPAQVEETVRTNTEARLRALKIGLLFTAGLALLTIIPASSLPRYRPGEVPEP